MNAVLRLTTVVALLLILAGGRLRAQDPAFQEQMRSGDQAMQRQQYDQAVQAYKKAYSISKKSSFDAAAASVLACRALGDYKSALDMAGDAVKLAGQDAHLQAQGHNLRGSALYALSSKPDDKRMKEAEAEFRAARAKQLIAGPRRARLTFAPSFSFTSRAGDHIALDDYKGKTIVMDFWGSWCPPCRASTPSLISLHKKYAGQGVVFLGVAQDKEKDFTEYVDKHHVDWPQFLDTSRTVQHQFAITAFPTFIVIDGEGVIRGRMMGWGPEIQSWLEDEIKKSLILHPSSANPES